MRLRVTRVYDILDFTAKKDADFQAKLKIAWGTQDDTYPQCRLISQDETGQGANDAKKPNDPPPQLVRVYEEISATAETQVGDTDVSFDQYGRQTVVNEWIQFSTGTPVYGTVGTTAASAPFAACILKTEERTNDGTLQRIKRTYIDAGELSDSEELKFGGKLLLRTLTYLNEIPPTPSGFTLVTQSTEFVTGLKVYRYGFASAAAGIGLGGKISDSIVYNGSPNQGTTGVTVETIKWITDLTVSSNPIPTPSGFQLISFEYSDSDGFRIWTAIYAFGQGQVSATVDIRNNGKLYVYNRTAINAVPSTPSATIGGTVVLIRSEVRNGIRTEDGTLVYEYQWAEGNGVVANDIVGESDGALVQTITQLNAAITTPTTPGAGWYLINLSNDARDGHYLNRAIYKKPPADNSFKKQMGFEMPGAASFTGSPPQFLMQPPSNRTLLADVSVTYGTSQISDTPFSLNAGASFYETYVPTDTGIAVQTQRGLGGYIAGASSISGTNSNYNGVLCTTWQAVLVSSIPSSLPTGLTVIHTDNDPYLTDITGTIVYRRTKATYTF